MRDVLDCASCEVLVEGCGRGPASQSSCVLCVLQTRYLSFVFDCAGLQEDYRRARSAAITSELLPAHEEAWSFNQANIMEVHEGAMRVIEAAISKVQSAFSLTSA